MSVVSSICSAYGTSNDIANYTINTCSQSYYSWVKPNPPPSFVSRPRSSAPQRGHRAIRTLSVEPSDWTPPRPHKRRKLGPPLVSSDASTGRSRAPRRSHLTPSISDTDLGHSFDVIPNYKVNDEQLASYVGRWVQCCAVAVAGSGGWTRSVLNDEETEKYRHDTTQRMRRKIRT